MSWCLIYHNRPFVLPDSHCAEKKKKYWEEETPVIYCPLVSGRCKLLLKCTTGFIVSNDKELNKNSPASAYLNTSYLNFNTCWLTVDKLNKMAPKRWAQVSKFRGGLWLFSGCHVSSTLVVIYATVCCQHYIQYIVVQNRHSQERRD